MHVQSIDHRTVAHARHEACLTISRFDSAEEEIFKMVLKSDLDFRTAPWPNVSDAAKDCVKRLLNRNASQRATAAEVLQHPWLTQQGLQSDRPLDNVVIKRMRQVSHSPAVPQRGFNQCTFMTY